MNQYQDSISRISQLEAEITILRKKNDDLQAQLGQARNTWTGDWEMDLKAKTVYWSPEVYHILGVNEKEKADMRFFKEKLPPACLDKLNGAINKVFITGKAYSFEHFIVVHDGNKVARTELKPILNEQNRPIKLLGKITDITNIKSEQKEMERLSLIAANTSNAVVMLNVDATVNWVNSAFTMMIGYRPEEIIDKEFKLIFADSECDLCCKDTLKNTFLRSHSVIEETTILAKNGREHHAVFNMSPMLDYELNPEGYIAIITDITEQKNVERLLKEKNKEILDSITYAKRIQDTILPRDESIKNYLPNSFVLYKPKDIVSGDFYWLEVKNDKVLFAAIDCTGHGVPGAFVSIVGYSNLQRAVHIFDLDEPAQILDKVSEGVERSFNKGNLKDGMDIALCAWNKKDNVLEYSGANNPLYLLRGGGRELEIGSRGEAIINTTIQDDLCLYEIKADKQPIGKFEGRKPFACHRIKLEQDDLIYIFTDGYQDQFGGPKGKKFKAKQFRELILSNHFKSMDEQKEILNNKLEEWKGDLEQIDDVCVIGVKI